MIDGMTDGMMYTAAKRTLSNSLALSLLYTVSQLAEFQAIAELQVTQIMLSVY